MNRLIEEVLAGSEDLLRALDRKTDTATSQKKLRLAVHALKTARENLTPNPVRLSL